MKIVSLLFLLFFPQIHIFILFAFFPHKKETILQALRPASAAKDGYLLESPIPKGTLNKREDPSQHVIVVLYHR